MMDVGLRNGLQLAVLVAALLHIVEEFVYPGGFLALMRRANPTLVRSVTPNFAVVINGLFVALCGLAAVGGARTAVLGLSVAALLFVNALIHVGSAIRFRRYTPGLLTAVLLYVPLSVLLYGAFTAAGAGTRDVVLGVGLGVLWQAVPVAFLHLSSRGRDGGTH